MEKEKEKNDKDKQQIEEENDPIYLMEEILDKLKLLNYEVFFLKHKINKPLSRNYFALKSTTPGDQFIYFSSLCFWLLNLCGSQIQGDKKYDDPNTASQNIINESKNIGVDLNVPINKLRNGYGEFACLVLVKLVNKAIEKKGIGLRKTKEETGRSSSNEANYIEIEEDIPDQINQEINFGDNIQASKVEEKKKEPLFEEEFSILKSNIPKKAWIREVEKVSNKLKIDYEETSGNSNSEWRSHVEHIKSSDKKLFSILPQSRSALENLSDDIGGALDKINKKEAMVSKNFTQIITEYKSRQLDSNNQIDEFNLLRSTCDKMQKELEELEEKETDINEKFSKVNKTINNTSLSINLKQALLGLTQESIGIDIKIAILNHSINSFRQRGIYSLQVNNITEMQDVNLWDETK